ncbi:sigma factor-like helix-turn-helix DNA-binding protein [Listeria booriae]|uniref:sigma factor-like helix-turn-helix DNA-binding protein n=1 Tax=Listeria booriae TaxID=1552123 RepID=UPI0016253D27|nr:sigma factor-like helix-turn-helix DNA-binding protein [Listeria booriae]MBC1231506.1 RNA polymerase subunit sigma-24 [Listeria booriae]MBC1801107.1 RNA polymerase subunit sigma-24 [Listeria booriae]
MKDLIREYNQALRELEAMRVIASEEDSVIIGGMISDVRYALEWMRSARMPGNRRGIERRSSYQRELSIDAVQLQAYIGNQEGKESTISLWDKEKIDNCLSILSNQQKDCFYMHVAKMYSLEDVASILGLKKTTVQNHVDRAKNKIKDYLENKPAVQFELF